MMDSSEFAIYTLFGMVTQVAEEKSSLVWFIDIEYNKRLDHRRPCIEASFVLNGRQAAWIYLYKLHNMEVNTMTIIK